jgi:ribosomal protein S27AE
MGREEFEKFKAEITYIEVKEEEYIPQLVSLNEWIIFCPNCGATVILGSGRKESAIELWNMRTVMEPKDANS